jgi:hypothetical protein
MEVKIKYHRPQSEVKCYCCGNILKDGSEIRRTEKLGKNTIVRLLVLERVEFQILKVMSHFLQSDNRKDKYTGLREHLNRAKKRGKRS